MRPRHVVALGLCGALAAGASLPAWSQRDWARVAVPAYNPAHLMQGVHRHWTAPRSDEFAVRAQALVPALRQLCEAAPPSRSAERLGAARDAWRSATAAWERLSAVALGPLIERRSARRIDFTPTRPALIGRAIAAAPQGQADMERIGTPAKGLPALEWLLWTRPVGPGSPGCGYAVEVAADVEREAVALQGGFRALAERAWDDEAAVAGVDEFVNQWLGGVERLRWAQMEKPLRSAAGGTASLPRVASSSTSASWAAQWEALRALSTFGASAAPAPAPGAGLVPIETYLRGRGLNAVADRLAQATAKVDRDLRNLAPRPVARVQTAARDLAALKQLAEAEIAPALDVSIGFSDADGD